MPDAAVSGRRVLVVEDEYFLADELNRVLQAAGVTVLGPVPTVEAALGLLELGAPDAAVLDVNLGGETVYPVADALTGHRVPFLFVTGYDQEALPARHAAVHRLEKPVEPRMVLGEVRRLFGDNVQPEGGRGEGR